MGYLFAASRVDPSSPPVWIRQPGFTDPTPFSSIANGKSGWKSGSTRPSKDIQRAGCLLRINSAHILLIRLWGIRQIEFSTSNSCREAPISIGASLFLRRHVRQRRYAVPISFQRMSRCPADAGSARNVTYFFQREPFCLSRHQE